NPISFVETDGHMAIADGGGGGSYSASPPPPPPPSNEDTQGGVEGAKRFAIQFGKDMWNAGAGFLNLYDKLDQCGMEGKQEACDQLEQQFTTKQGWTNTWNAIKEPFVNDCRPSANRAPECAAHVATSLAEILVGAKGAGKAGSVFRGTAGAAGKTFATKPGGAFFWSGRTGGVGGESVARSIAKARGGTTLEMLMEERGIKLPTWDPSNPATVQAWKDASEAYAQGASGQVRAVVGTDLRPGNVWEDVELPALMRNPNVTSIVKIDPATGAETTIFTR
ncbi:MAG TPA: hypothetical protein VHI50_03560, partial [Micromonosporaceae bacterium]|nr:hypothetical protein [Micromonosporaceae bacterium]